MKLEDGAWIDLLHFFELAKWAMNFNETVEECIGVPWGGEFVAFFAGWANEWGQALRLDSSGHPFGGNEDMGSNMAGADFADEYMDKNKSLADNVVDYLKEQHGNIVEPPRTGSSKPKASGPSASVARASEDVNTTSSPSKKVSGENKQDAGTSSPSKAISGD